MEPHLDIACFRLMLYYPDHLERSYLFEFHAHEINKICFDN